VKEERGFLCLSKNEREVEVVQLEQMSRVIVSTKLANIVVWARSRQQSARDKSVENTLHFNVLLQLSSMFD
jgi:hypothetical protein